MLDLPRLTLQRQRRVFLALRDASEDKAATKALHPDVRGALTAAVAAGSGLTPDRELPPLVLDNTTDVVIGAFDDLLEAVEKGMTDRVVRPLTPEQAEMKAAATTLRQRAFPNGTGYLTGSMGQQYKVMRELADALEKDRECVAAVRALHVKWFVDHLVAHLAPYGRAVKAADGRDLEAESDAFHGAFVDLAVKATAHHGASADVRKLLLGAYETELAAQREDEREARKRAKKKREPADE